MATIKFRNKDTNNNPVFILLIAVLFIAVGIGLYFVSRSTEEDNATLLLVVGILFGVFGLYFLLFGIYRCVLLTRVKKLLVDPNAKTTDAKFIKARYSSFSGNESGVGRAPLKAKYYAFEKLFYEYTDETGVQRTVKSVLSYTPNQVRYLKEKGSFTIKCKGKLSAIVEEIPDIEAALKVNAFKGEFEAPCAKKDDEKGE